MTSALPLETKSTSFLYPSVALLAGSVWGFRVFIGLHTRPRHDGNILAAWRSFDVVMVGRRKRDGPICREVYASHFHGPRVADDELRLRQTVWLVPSGRGLQRASCIVCGR